MPPVVDSAGAAVAPDSLAPAPSPEVEQAPDSLSQVPDSAAADAAAGPETQVPDSLGQVPDSLGQVPDSLGQLPDSLPEIDFDTIPVPVMPSAVRGEALGWLNEVWEWDRDALRSTRAMELEELISTIPATVSLRGGYFGMPRQTSAFAAGGGRIRLFWDGFEMVPLEGGVPDLARVSLGGVERVRVERTGGGLRVEIWSIEQSDPRPYTLIETGTGDLETQQFRGTFGHPRALGGKLYVALDRLDTQGPQRTEPGSSVGYWLSYSYEPSETWGIRAELRSMTSDRDTIYLPNKVNRKDWVIRARTRLWQDMVGEVFAGSGSVSASDADSLVQFQAPSRKQYGLRLGVEKPVFWVDGSARLQTGTGIPKSVVEGRGGFRSANIGSIEGGLTREGWDGGAATSFEARAWTRPFYGVSFFGSFDTGRRGVPFVLPPDGTTQPPDSTLPPDSVAPPVITPSTDPRFTDRTTTRIGAQFEWRGVRLSGASLRLEADSLHPLGLPPDRAGIAVEGGTRSGLEVAGELPLLLDGLALRGSYQWWDDEPRMRYLPKRIWKAEIDWNRTFLESGNLQFLATLGVQGRDAMFVPLADAESSPDALLLQTVPWYQSWFVRLQIRVLTFRIFITAENLSNKLDNQDYPGRVLPAFRSYYGVRWTLWN